MDDEMSDEETEEEESDSECESEDANDAWDGDDVNGAKHERDPTPRSPLDSYKTFTTPSERASIPRTSSNRKQRADAGASPAATTTAAAATQIVSGTLSPRTRATPAEEKDDERVIKSIIKSNLYPK